MLVFRSRYIVITKVDNTVIINHKPRYYQVIALILCLLGLSWIWTLVSSGIGLVIQLILVYSIVLHLLIGLIHSRVKYPVKFNNSEIIYKSISYFFVSINYISYSDIELVYLNQETEERWKFEVRCKGKRVVRIRLYVSEHEQQIQMLNFEKELRYLNVPLNVVNK